MYIHIPIYVLRIFRYFLLLLLLQQEQTEQRKIQRSYKKEQKKICVCAYLRTHVILHIKSYESHCEWVVCFFAAMPSSWIRTDRR